MSDVKIKLMELKQYYRTMGGEDGEKSVLPGR